MAALAIAKPEIFLLAALCMVLLLDIFLGRASPLIAYLAAQLALWTTALIVFATTFTGEGRLGINGMYILDEVGGLLKISILLISSMAFVYARKYLRDQAILGGEFYVLGLGAVLGMLIMVSGYNLLVLYLGLELLALSLYALVAIQRDNGRATEAAMKYFVLGAIASGLLLYGISIIYGLTGELDLQPIVDALKTADVNNNLLFLFALVFIIAGLAFKFGAVPFHMWLPDVYQGAPTAVTLFLGSAPKIAGLALAIRLLSEGMAGGQASWAQLLLVLGLLSVVVGNLVAIAQLSLKRMLAYSTVAHMGFVLLALLTGTVNGASAAIFYVITYAIMSAAAFALLVLLGRAGYDPDALDSLKGLNERSPWFAFMMLLVMFSMAGIPPTVGFYAKLMVLKEVLGQSYYLAALIMVVMSVIGAFYYLRAVKLMYFDEPEDQLPLRADPDFRVLFSVHSLSLLVLGLFPGWLMGFCMSAVSNSNLSVVLKTGAGG